MRVPGSVSNSRGVLRGRRGNLRGQKDDASVCACGLNNRGCGWKVSIHESFYDSQRASTLQSIGHHRKDLPTETASTGFPRKVAGNAPTRSLLGTAARPDAHSAHDAGCMFNLRDLLPAEETRS